MKLTKIAGRIASVVLADAAKAVVSEIRCQFRSFVRGQVRKVARIDDVSTQDIMKDSL